jgi:hypothetical protein
MYTLYKMKCDVDKIIKGTPERKYYLIKYLKTELEKILGKEIQIYLVISENERNEFFKLPQLYFNMNGFNMNGFNMNNFSLPTSNYLSLGNSNYSPGELTLPYKNFYNYFESIFHKNTDKDIQKEKDKHLDFLNNKVNITGGATFFQTTTEETPKIEKTNDDIEIEKFLFYTFNKDLKIRISTKTL